MGALSVILVPVLQPPVTTLGGALLALPLLIGFTRDWLVVSGKIDPDGASYQRIRRRLKLVVLHWLPILLRTLAITASVHLGSAGATAGLESSAFMIAGAAVGVGVAPRISAAFLLALLLARAAAGGSSPTLLIGVTAAVGVMMVGGGVLSVWQPEVRWFRRRAGDKGTVA